MALILQHQQVRCTGSFTASASGRNEVTDSAVTEIIKEIKLITEEGVTEVGVKQSRKVCRKFYNVNRAAINNCWLCN